MNNTICEIGHLNSSTLCGHLHASCDSKYYFIAAFYFCSHSDQLLARALISAAIIVVIIAMISLLSVILSNFLLFSVTNFTDLLGVSHNCLSCVVIPALNSVPDIINYHYSLSSNSADLIMGQVIGANLITFTVIMGMIAACVAPFEVTDKMALLREYSYISALVVIMTYVVSDSRLTILECICLMSMYFLYILTLLSFPASESSKMDLALRNDNGLVPAAETSSLMTSNEIQDSIGSSGKLNLIKLMAYISGLLDLFLMFVIPISKKALKKRSHFPYPIQSRILSSHVFHVWITFTCICLLNFVFFKLRAWTLIPAVAGISSIEFAPSFTNHEFCNVLVDFSTIFNSIIIVTKLTKILIQLLKNLGLMWNVSQYVMGLIVFSLLNSINDIIMNVSLAVKFNPSHGINSCLGSCCILILLGLGFNGFWLMLGRGLQSKNVWQQFLPITLDWELYVSLASLNLVTLSTLGYILLNNWVVDMKLGCFLISFWIFTIITCVLCSRELITPG